MGSNPLPAISMPRHRQAMRECLRWRHMRRNLSSAICPSQRHRASNLRTLALAHVVRVQACCCFVYAHAHIRVYAHLPLTYGPSRWPVDRESSQSIGQLVIPISLGLTSGAPRAHVCFANRGVALSHSKGTSRDEARWFTLDTPPAPSGQLAREGSPPGAGAGKGKVETESAAAAESVRTGGQPESEGGGGSGGGSEEIGQRQVMLQMCFRSSPSLVA